MTFHSENKLEQHVFSNTVHPHPKKKKKRKTNYYLESDCTGYLPSVFRLRTRLVVTFHSGA